MGSANTTSAMITKIRPSIIFFPPFDETTPSDEVTHLPSYSRPRLGSSPIIRGLWLVGVGARHALPLHLSNCDVLQHLINREALLEGERERCCAVRLQHLQPLARFLRGRDVPRRNPPQHQHRRAQ